MIRTMYSLAIRRRKDNKDHFWFHNDYQFIELKIDTGNGRFWYADPFIFEYNEICYIFFEVFDLVSQKGKIGYCILLEDGTCTSPKIILDEAYHLSFPNIFIYEDEVYMMPEMCGDHSQKLYKAISFPDKWEISQLLLPDVYACDSIFLEKDGRRYLLTNEMYHHNVPNNQYASCWVKNYLYKIAGKTVMDHGTFISEGDFGLRNAGKAFILNDHMLYRIGQDCRNRSYGRGLVLFKINSFSPYNEEMVWSLTCDEINGYIKREDPTPLIGIHTYNFSEHFEIVDYIQERSQPAHITFMVNLQKVKNKILHLLKCFI